MAPELSVAEQILKLGYGDLYETTDKRASRSLHFRVLASLDRYACSPIAIRRCLAVIGAYNAFDADLVFAAFEEQLSGLDLHVSIGREGSPVMYLCPAPGAKIPSFRARCEAFAAQARCTESDLLESTGEYRCWWD